MTALKRLVALMVAVGAAALLGLGFAGSASAYDGTAATPCTTVTAGATCTITGTAIAAGDTVSAEIHSVVQQLGTTVAGTNGKYSLTVTIPNVGPGAHQIWVYDRTKGVLINKLAITIVAGSSASATSTGSGSGGTSSTGVAVFGIAAVGVALLGGGAALLLAGRRRAGSHS